MLDAFKKYPSQISSAFRRFPIAVAFSFVSFAMLIVNTEYVSLIDIVLGSAIVRFLIWLGIYPIAAVLVSLTTSLVQESLNIRNKKLQLITGGTWFTISLALVNIFLEIGEDFTFYFATSTTLAYTIILFGFFFAPFWKQPNEDGFWVFLCKVAKAFVIAIIVAAILLGAMEGLILGFTELFDESLPRRLCIYTIYFCASVVAPVLFFSGIPSIDECTKEPPSLSRFTIGTIRFLFVPVLTISILLFYCYIVKFVMHWDMPRGMISYFVSSFVGFTLALIVVMYPSYRAPGNTPEKKLLKIFPAACIPLIALMTIGLVRRISEYGISELRIYALVINIFFYIIMATLLIDRVKHKYRYIAIAFCALFFIFAVSPFNAQSISNHVWMKSIKEALIEQGYTEFPLDTKDTREFVHKLKEKNDKNARLVISRLTKMRSISSGKSSSTTLANYLSTKSIPSIYQVYEESALDYSEVDEVSDTADTDSVPFEPFEVSLDYPEKKPLEVPRGAKAAVTVDRSFDDSEFEFRGDTLTFRVSLKEEGCGCDESSACADSTVDSTGAVKTSDIYSFTVDRQTLKQDTTKFFKTDKATLAISHLYAEEQSNNKSLKITGILFIE